VGKTTVARALLGFDGKLPPLNLSLVPKPKWTICGPLVAAGHYTGDTFDGADTVPYNGALAALEFWSKELLPTAHLTLFDGDRFSNKNSFDFVKAKADKTHIFHLGADASSLAARRAARGSNQNPTWLAGRETKAINFYNNMQNRLDDCRVLTTGRSPEDVTANVRECLLRICGWPAP
jgi:hypothetical protein